MGLTIIIDAEYRLYNIIVLYRLNIANVLGFESILEHVSLQEAFHMCA